MSVPRVVSLTVILTVTLAVAAASAATIRLKSGRELSGEIVRETPEGVELRMGGGKMWIPRRQIEEVVRDGAAPAPRPSGPTRPRPAAPAPTPGNAVSVFAAVGSGRLRIEAVGEGIESVRVTATPLRRDDRPIVIPPGALLVPRSSSGPKPAQRMVVADRAVFRVGEKPVTFRVAAASANLDGRVPGPGDALDLVKDGASESLRRLAPHLPRGSSATRQAAVWIITDDATYEGLGRLAVTVPDAETGRSVRRRAIDPGVTAAAMQLIESAGLRLDARRIWRSRALLVSVLVPPSDHPADRSLAAWARGKLSGYGRDVPSIVVGVLSARVDDTALREACRVAANHGIREALPALRRVAGEAARSLAARTAATQAIAMIASRGASASPAGTGSSELDGLLETVAGPEGDGRSRALLALVDVAGKIPAGPARRRVGAALAGELRPPESRLTDALFRAIETYRDAIDPAAVVAATRQSDKRVRLAAVRLLVNFRSSAATERLATLLRDPDAETCLAALFAVPNHPRAWPIMVHLLGHERAIVRQQAAAALAVVRPEASFVTALARCLRDGNADVRAVAASTLGSPNWCGSRQAVPDLKAALAGDASGVVRVQCAYALTAILRDGALPALRDALARAKRPQEKKAIVDCIRHAQGR